jgi:hypothetical protein
MRGAWSLAHQRSSSAHRRTSLLCQRLWGPLRSVGEGKLALLTIWCARCLLTISSGIDTVVDLGAGLDTRPYRMELPASLRWVEIDYPDLIASKEARLRAETPVCPVERIGFDLAERGPRQILFDRIGATSASALVLTEGVVPYLSVTDAATLAADLHAQPSFERWVTDYFSPVLLRYLRKRPSLANVPFLFRSPRLGGVLRRTRLAPHGDALPG